MTKKLCVTIAEVEGYIHDPSYAGNVGDIVFGGADDIIYFYHVDSCMAVVLYNREPMGAGKHTFVGVHIVMNTLGFDGPQWADPAGAVRYYIPHLKAIQGSNFEYGAFIGGKGLRTGDENDWFGPAEEMVKALHIPKGNAKFFPIATRDVWAFSDGGVLVTSWDKKLNTGHLQATKPYPREGGNIKLGQGGEKLL